ncbi:MAG: DUF421 domain-containing protein [Fimbriimonadaceae bacterium]
MNAWLKQVFDHPDVNGSLVIAGKTLFIYAFLIAGLRLLGKRELGQMTIYDLVLIIVLGNAVQNGMMNNDNSLGGGLIASTVLLLANRLLNLVLRHSKRIERAMVGEPRLILNDGEPIPSHMAKEGITLDQLKTALREHGLTNFSEVRMAVLEVDGTISVVPKDSTVLQTKRRFKALRLP